MEKTYVAGDSGSFPGPDWQPKQAHAADIQAEASSINLIAELNGKAELKTFEHELFCIIDTLSHGVMIKRTSKGTTMLPPLRIMHYAKRFFERLYLKQYR
jgi:sulfide:quinone oxidoreductase